MPQACWRHVLGEENPADLVSRGVSNKKLAASQLWWPQLVEGDKGPSSVQRIAVDEVENLELIKVAVHTIANRNY